MCLSILLTMKNADKNIRKKINKLTRESVESMLPPSLPILAAVPSVMRSILFVEEQLEKFSWHYRNGYSRLSVLTSAKRWHAMSWDNEKLLGHERHGVSLFGRALACAPHWNGSGRGMLLYAKQSRFFLRVGFFLFA